MSTITPTSKQHPLIIKGSMKSLYQELIKCKMCPRLVDFREKIAKEKRKQYKDWVYWVILVYLAYSITSIIGITYSLYQN